VGGSDSSRIVLGLFFLIQLHWELPNRSLACSACAVLIHPASFFLIVGYSESLFCMTLLGLIYWSSKLDLPQETCLFWRRLFIAGVHGFIMCSTRLFGVPAAFLPLLQNLGKWNRRSVLIGLGIAALSIAGTFSFFLWCHYHLGIWDLYIQMQRIGWGNVAAYDAVFRLSSYLPRFFSDPEMMTVNRSAVPLILVMGVASFVLDSSKGRKEKLGFYAVAGSIFYLAVSTKANSNMDSFVRYTYPAYILLVLGISRALNDSQSGVKQLFSRRWFQAMLIVLGVLSLIIQSIIAYRFTHGRWVT
jgi:hypothetical protein